MCIGVCILNLDRSNASVAPGKAGAHREGERAARRLQAFSLDRIQKSC